MTYQAKKAEEQGTEGAVEALNACMASDFKAGEEVKKFAEINPGRTYSRKVFIDWASFVQSHGKYAADIDRSKSKTMWKGEFMRWPVNIKALSDEEAGSRETTWATTAGCSCGCPT